MLGAISIWLAETAIPYMRKVFGEENKKCRESMKGHTREHIAKSIQESTASLPSHCLLGANRRYFPRKDGLHPAIL